MVYEVGDVFETYVYREGIISGNYSFSVAVGLFKSIISAVLIVSANRLAEKFGEEGLF